MAVLLTEVRIDRPSIATLSSTYSTPASLQAAASSSLIARDASEMSVSPAQNFLKPSPVPGPSTVYSKPGFASLNSRATPDEIGSTVDEPETKIEPETAPPASGLPAAPPSVAGAVVAPEPPPQAATKSAVASARPPMRLGVASVTKDSSR